MLHNITIQMVRLDNVTSTSLLKLFNNDFGIYVLNWLLESTIARYTLNVISGHHERITLWTHLPFICDSPSFPLDAWECFFPQKEKANINLLQPSAVCSLNSAWKHVCGKFEFNDIPLARFDIRAVILDPPTVRPSWAKRGTDCFCVSLVVSHYRCYMPSTCSIIRLSDSVAWSPLPTLIPIFLSFLSQTYPQRSHRCRLPISRTL